MAAVATTSLRRERLVSLIGSALEAGAFTLLVAPPGYGKTIALRDTIGADPTVYWIQLRPGTQLEEIVRQLTATAVPDHLGAVHALFGGSGEAKELSAVIEWMSRRLRAFCGTIVIDDLHCALGDPSAVEFLTKLIENTASYVRWIGASREVPSLPIGTWVARGMMSLPVTDDDLAFDVDEAAALAAARRVDIEHDILRAIVADTGGWPMAIHLALQLWDRTRSMTPLKMRTRDVLFSQIETELWPSCPPDVREIIGACALLPQINSAILEAAGFAQAELLLERAHNAVPFVQRAPGGEYVLHELFAEFVHTVVRRQPDQLAALRDRLATALVSTGRHADALGVLLAARDQTRVLALLAQAGFALIESGHRSVVLAALSFLAETGHRNHAAVAALRGMLSYADGSAANAEALYRYACAHGLPPEMRVETCRRLATAYVNRGASPLAVEIFASLLADATIPAADLVELRSSQACALAAAGRPGDARRMLDAVLIDLAGAAPEARARILQRLGFAAFYIGDLERAETFARDAAHLATQLKMWSYAALAHSVLYGVACSTQSDSTIALQHARLTAAAGERAGDNGLMAYGLRAEYLLHAYRGDVDAFAASEAQLRGFGDVRTFRSSFPARHARAFADVLRGQVRRAISTLTVIDQRELGDAERALCASTLALFLFLADRREDSLEHVKSPLLLEASDDFMSRRYVNLARLIRGLALWCHDRTAQARRVLHFDEEAVAENDRVLLTTIADLCATPRHLLAVNVVNESLARLQAHGWGGYGRIIEMILAKVEPTNVLTAAEIKTLRAFQNGANTLQVADNLGKSPHTIEAQLKSAYKKIGCVSRAEALVYARARGWLDDHLAGIPESC
jgi:ATP/maltotriose-dependent transcriptional regulator MalT